MSDAESSDAMNKDISSTPLRKYIVMVGDKKDNKWICNFSCKTDPYTGTYSRIRAHFIGLRKGEKTRGIALCSKLTNDDREKLKKEEEARDLHGGDLRKRKSDTDTLTMLPPTKKVGSKIVSDMFRMSSREDADIRIARLFYSCGISFNVARSPFWRDAVKAINEAPKVFYNNNYWKLAGDRICERISGREDQGFFF
ncbi:hypothetical protein BUALT_Bualt12G0142900 [Buddleja alternifolia]|uniref:Uncharacterized protein n=1 Tax=Buddleja alternifolia TaxID=168488 RepID=A0AAV6WXK2_9LAMI|nr:hypothetical protein BUALT_Bualt12G0142900 [Buddleja alternifolia]